MGGSVSLLCQCVLGIHSTLQMKTLCADVGQCRKTRGCAASIFDELYFFFLLFDQVISYSHFIIHFANQFVYIYGRATQVV